MQDNKKRVNGNQPASQAQPLVTAPNTNPAQNNPTTPQTNLPQQPQEQPTPPTPTQLQQPPVQQQPPTQAPQQPQVQPQQPQQPPVIQPPPTPPQTTPPIDPQDLQTPLINQSPPQTPIPPPVPPLMPSVLQPPPYMQPTMPIQSQQAVLGESLKPAPQNQPFTPIQGQDPYCCPVQPPSFQETEKQIEAKLESPPMAISEEVVEYKVTEDKIEDAPDLQRTTVNLQTAGVVELEDQKVIKPTEEALHESDEEIVVDDEKKGIWKPPDVDD